MKIKQTISKINFRNIFLFISWSLVIVFFIYVSINAVEVRNHELCKAISFKIDQGEENYFIDEEDLKRELLYTKTSLVGKRMVDINFKKIERNIDKNVFVEKAVMYKSVAGNIIIEVQPKNPIARVWANNGMNYYVSDHWKLMPISSKYTKKVVLITGDISDIINHDNERDSLFNKQLQAMTNFIIKDPFWSAFIDQIHVENGRKISLITSVIEPTITFGVIDSRMENKFKKVEVFLKNAFR